MIDRGTGTLEKTSGPGKNDPFQERYNQLDHNQTLSDNYQQFIDKLKLTPDQDYTNPLAPIRNHQFGQLSPVEERIADRRTMVGSAFSGDKMIARAQANLAIAGYELDGEGFKGVNGKEGPKTTQAVKDFQTAAGLKPTGIIDQETIKAMDLAAEKGMTKQEIEALGNQIAKQNEPPPVGDQPQEHQLTPELTPQEQQQLAKRDDLVKQAYSTTKGGNYQLAQAQASLELAGYKLEKHGIDGKMGDETRANLRQFQKDWGIPETSDFYETYYALREATVKEWKRPPEQKVEQEPGKQPVKELKSELTPKLEKEDMIPHYTGTYDKAAQFNRIGKILPQKNFVYDQVKDSQTKLKEMGFNIGPAGADGKAGKYTREAVIEFQKMNHLKITGELDKVTAAQIESEYQMGAVVEEANQVMNSIEHSNINEKKSSISFGLKDEWKKIDGVSIVKDKGTYPVIIRSDVAESFSSTVTKINKLGGKVVSAGGKRPLSMHGGPGSSATSLHYTGLAVDLATNFGMGDPKKDLYVIVKVGGTDEKPRWNVYCRTENKNVKEITLNASNWEKGSGLKEQEVTGRFIDVTAIMKENGWKPISAQKGWKDNYMKCEWWHFEKNESLIKDKTIFKNELLKVYDQNEIEKNFCGDRAKYLDYIWGNGLFEKQ